MTGKIKDPVCICATLVIDIQGIIRSPSGKRVSLEYPFDLISYELDWARLIKTEDDLKDAYTCFLAAGVELDVDAAFQEAVAVQPSKKRASIPRHILKAHSAAVDLGLW